MSSVADDVLDNVNEEFESNATDQGSHTYPVQCSALRKNGFVMMKGFPCKIVEMSSSKTGKHGRIKFHLVGIDIFTGKKYDELSPSTQSLQVPRVAREDYQLTYMSDDGYLHLLSNSNVVREDFFIGKGEMFQKLEAAYNEGKDLIITVLSACGSEAVVAFKENTVKSS